MKKGITTLALYVAAILFSCSTANSQDDLSQYKSGWECSGHPITYHGESRSLKHSSFRYAKGRWQAQEGHNNTSGTQAVITKYSKHSSQSAADKAAKGMCPDN